MTDSPDVTTDEKPPTPAELVDAVAELWRAHQLDRAFDDSDMEPPWITTCSCLEFEATTWDEQLGDAAFGRHLGALVAALPWVPAAHNELVQLRALTSPRQREAMVDMVRAATRLARIERNDARALLAECARVMQYNDSIDEEFVESVRRAGGGS